tara:strand:- start:3791 stop:4792 length:1002 start_codon:yes stop_codon:yes gene_type:complete
MLSKAKKISNIILFEKKRIKIDKVKDIELESVLNLMSQHLMLPTLYFNIKKKKYQKYFPEDFIKFLKQIFEENKKRNALLIKEAHLISNLLNENNIKYCFIKGMAYMLSGLYTDSGERMVGDIDILVQEDELKRAHQLLSDFGYISDGKYSFKTKQFRYYDRQINRSKKIAVELHRRTIESKSLKKLDSEEILENKLEINNVSVPCNKDLLLTNIYSHQINDYGFYTLSYNYRNLYDTFLLKSNSKFDIIFDKYIQNYFNISSRLGVNFFPNFLRKKNFFLSLRFRLKKYFLIRLIDSFIFLNLAKIPIQIKKIKEIFYNENYRKYIFKKLKL